MFAGQMIILRRSGFVSTLCLPSCCLKFSATGSETSGDLVTSLSSLFKSDGYKMADRVFEKHIQFEENFFFCFVQSRYMFWLNSLRALVKEFRNNLDNGDSLKLTSNM